MNRLLPALALAIALPTPALAELSAREKTLKNIAFESGVAVTSCVLYEKGKVASDQIKYVVGRLWDYDRSGLSAQDRQIVHDSLVSLQVKAPKCVREFKRQWALANKPVSPAFNTSGDLY